jgi:hypothetical protein
MFKLAKSRFFVFFSAFSFLLFCVPEIVQGQETGRGEIVGYVYGPDNTTPVEGAVVKLKNVETGSEYESVASDDQGMVVVENVDKGLYMVGISTAQGDYNIGNLIGVKSRRTSTVSFALKPPDGQEEGEAVGRSKRCPKGEWYVPEIQGQCDDNYKWNPDAGRCECKKKSPLAFFLTPLGAGIVVAASAGVVAFSLSGNPEVPASAFR